jgi:hypothetical protein
VLPERAFTVQYANCAAQPLRGDEAIRRAVLLVFRDSLPEQCSMPRDLSEMQWRKLAHWLDLSGLALYFFDRISALGWHDLLPAGLSARLQQNLRDNTARTRSMLSESIGIQREFQELQVQYAVLKGLSLWPHSVPRPELRSQFDLDFLVDEGSASMARRLLERRGYRLYAISGRSWEFKRNERPGISVKDMYKDFQSWAVELHIEAKTSRTRSQLARRQTRNLFGFTMPVLSDVDLFIGQGLHACKHICGEYVRAAHLEEFRRHVVYRWDDKSFWRQVKDAAAQDSSIAVRLGVVIQLITHTLGDFAPEALVSWTTSRLPTSTKLWIEIYGVQAVLGSFPGSKRSLLLQGTLEQTGAANQMGPQKSLLPSGLPPAVIRRFEDENVQTRIARNWMQLKFVLHRLRFHILAGIDYMVELRRWRRILEQTSR